MDNEWKNTHYHKGFYRGISYWGYIGIMEKKMESDP